LNIGVVGCGYWGPNLVRNLVETGRCDQICVFDKKVTATTKLLRRFPSLKISDSVEQLVSDCDAILVCTPVQSHYSIARIALEQGKAVFVEKPLTNSIADALDLVNIAEQKSATLMVGHTFIYSPPVRKVKEYIDAGMLGQIYFLSSSRVNLGLHRQDVNVLWDLAPHDLSILMYWIGETPARISALGRACVGAHIDVASIHCEFPSGIVANIEVSWLAPSKLRRTVVVGSQRMVVYDDTEPAEKVRLYDRGAQIKDPESFGEYQLTYRSGDILTPNLDVAEPLLIQANHFLDCVETGTQPQTDGRAGLDVVIALEAADRSLRDSGKLVHTADICAESLGVTSAPSFRMALANISEDRTN
jgi:predicted dehydrogenase